MNNIKIKTIYKSNLINFLLIISFISFSLSQNLIFDDDLCEQFGSNLIYHIINNNTKELNKSKNIFNSFVL